MARHQEPGHESPTDISGGASNENLHLVLRRLFGSEPAYGSAAPDWSAPVLGRVFLTKEATFWK
jgi:hypothetical protein